MASRPKRARKIVVKFDLLSEMSSAIVSEEQLLHLQQIKSGMERHEESEIEIQKAAQGQATDITHLINVPLTRHDANFVAKRKKSAAPAPTTPYYVISNFYNLDDEDYNFCAVNKLSVFTLRTFFTYKAWNQREDMFRKIPGVELELYHRMDTYYHLKEFAVKRRMYDCNELLPQLQTTYVTINPTYICFLSRPPDGAAVRKKLHLERYAYIGALNIYQYAQKFQTAFLGIMGKVQIELLDVEAYHTAGDSMMKFITKNLRAKATAAIGNKVVKLLSATQGLSLNEDDDDDQTDLEDGFPDLQSVQKEFSDWGIEEFMKIMDIQNGLESLTVNEAEHPRPVLGSIELEDESENDMEVDPDHGKAPDPFDLDGVTKVKLSTDEENKATGLKANGTQKTHHKDEKDDNENDVEMGGPPPAKQTRLSENPTDNTGPKSAGITFTKHGAFNAAVKFLLSCLEQVAKPTPEYIGLGEIYGMIYPCPPLPYLAYHALLRKFEEDFMFENNDKPTTSYDEELASMTGQEFASRLYSTLKNGQVALFFSYASHASMGPDCFICAPEILRARRAETENFVPKTVNMQNLIFNANHLKIDEIQFEAPSDVKLPSIWEYDEDNLWNVATTLVYDGAYIVRDNIKIYLRLGPVGLLDCSQGEMENFAKVIDKAGRGFMMGCSEVKVLDENYSVVEKSQPAKGNCQPSIPHIAEADGDYEMIVDELYIIDRLPPLSFDEPLFMNGGIDLNMKNYPTFFTTQQMVLEPAKEQTDAEKIEVIQRTLDEANASDVYDYTNWQNDKRKTRSNRMASAKRCAKTYEKMLRKDRK